MQTHLKFFLPPISSLGLASITLALDISCWKLLPLLGSIVDEIFPGRFQQMVLIRKVSHVTWTSSTACFQVLSKQCLYLLYSPASLDNFLLLFRLPTSCPIWNLSSLILSHRVLVSIYVASRGGLPFTCWISAARYPSVIGGIQQCLKCLMN